MKVVISGGGTGGHIFPAIAIADAIRLLDPSAEIQFVGASGKMEMDLVPKAGYKITGLPVRGFQRKFSLKNLTLPFRLLGSMWKAGQLMLTFKPDVAIGVGGYASGPTLQMAEWMGIPSLLQEQNSYAGATNRILGRKAKKIFVAYEGMERFFPREKLVWTGNPVRANIGSVALNQEEAKQQLGLAKEFPVVFIFGGSLGAKTLNLAMENAIKSGSLPKDLNILWQTGRTFQSSCTEAQIAAYPNVRRYVFIDDMPVMYKAADVVVCRAGALTISEIALLRKPAILVPSPHVAEDHQTANAMALVNKNAAVLVRDSDSAENLITAMSTLVRDRQRLKILSENIGFFAKPDAAIKIAEEILKFCSTQAPA